MTTISRRSESEDWGGSRAGIQHHYDLSNDFYRLWLDADMNYSCGLWQGSDPNDTLERAQQRKLEFHSDAVGVSVGGSYLDIGCGWGAMMRQIHGRGAKRTVGLTLSKAQAEHIEGDARLQAFDCKVHLQSWTTHRPAEKYDGIVSVGAFEHFADPDQSPPEKLAVYRAFFERCATWLKGGGRLSLQTIAYGTMDPSEASAFMQSEIFPASELPLADEVINASRGCFELERFRNDRVDYGRTCEAWSSRLSRNRTAIVAMVGDEKFSAYRKYLKMSAFGFHSEKLELHRYVFRLRRSWSRRSEGLEDGN